MLPPDESDFLFVRWKQLTSETVNVKVELVFCSMGLRNRQNFLERRCFFVTSTCYEWLYLLMNDSYFEIINDSINFYNSKYHSHLLGYVWMPNHIHMILYFEKQNRLSDYMRDFKKYTSGEIRRKLDTEKYDLEKIKYQHRQQKFKIWMDRFDDVVLYTRRILEIKLNYIHQNPIKKSMVLLPEDYKYSSAAYYILQEDRGLPVLHYTEVL